MLVFVSMPTLSRRLEQRVNAAKEAEFIYFSSMKAYNLLCYNKPQQRDDSVS